MTQILDLSPKELARLRTLATKDPTTESERWYIRLLLPKLLAEIDRLSALIPPYPGNHLPECGTLYRGCAPNCPKRLKELEYELIELEDNELPDLKKQLARLEDPLYRPEDNPDDEHRQSDIQFLRREISEINRRIAQIKARAEKEQP